MISDLSIFHNFIRRPSRAGFIEELVKAGVLLDGSGLQPSAKGWRIKYSGNKRTVTEPNGLIYKEDPRDRVYTVANRLGFTRLSIVRKRGPQANTAPTTLR